MLREQCYANKIESAGVLKFLVHGLVYVFFTVGFYVG